jgi:hypothetical protein
MRPNPPELAVNWRYSPTRPPNGEGTETLVSMLVCGHSRTANSDACHAEGRGFESHHPLSGSRCNPSKLKPSQPQPATGLGGAHRAQGRDHLAGDEAVLGGELIDDLEGVGDLLGGVDHGR